MLYLTTFGHAAAAYLPLSLSPCSCSRLTFVLLLLMFQEESMKDAYSDDFGVIGFGGGGGGGGRKRKVGMARKVFHTHNITSSLLLLHLYTAS